MGPINHIACYRCLVMMSINLKLPLKIKQYSFFFEGKKGLWKRKSERIKSVQRNTKLYITVKTEGNKAHKDLKKEDPGIF